MISRVGCLPNGATLLNHYVHFGALEYYDVSEHLKEAISQLKLQAEQAIIEPLLRARKAEILELASRRLQAHEHGDHCCD